jgi:hypothetical protein
MSHATVDTITNLDTLAEGIREEAYLVERSFNDALRHAIKAGQLLIEAKSLVKHGEWMPWVEEQFPGSHSTANTYMRLAANSQRIANLPTMTEAIAALAAPQAKPLLNRGPLLDREGQEVTTERLEAAVQELEAVLATGQSMPRVSRETLLVALACAEWTLANWSALGLEGRAS